VLCVYQIPPEQKPDSLLFEKFPSLRKSKYRQEQLSPEHPPPKSSRTPQEEPNFVGFSAGATSPLLLRSLTTRLENIALREILLLEEIQG
jgi:hypothetical protein